MVVVVLLLPKLDHLDHFCVQHSTAAPSSSTITTSIMASWSNNVAASSSTTWGPAAAATARMTSTSSTTTSILRKGAPDVKLGGLLEELQEALDELQKGGVAVEMAAFKEGCYQRSEHDSFHDLADRKAKYAGRVDPEQQLVASIAGLGNWHLSLCCSMLSSGFLETHGYSLNEKKSTSSGSSSKLSSTGCMIQGEAKAWR